jgi:hypothetical protein
MRFLARFSNTNHSPNEVKILSRVAFQSVKPLGGDVGNMRVSSYAIELDLLIDSKSKLQDAIQALVERLGPLLTMRELDIPGPEVSVEEEIQKGIELFNSERFWESHEALEYAWRRASGSEKDTLQGVILVAAALVHLQKNESKVALGVMQRAYDKLPGNPVHSTGIDVENLRKELFKMIEQGNPEFLKLRTMS